MVKIFIYQTELYILMTIENVRQKKSQTTTPLKLQS